MTRTGTISWAGFLIATVLYIAVNMLLGVSAPLARLDVTEDGLYTLSEGTRVTIEKVDEPVEFHFFFSERLGREVPLYASYGNRIRDLLTEIAATSDGKVILHEHNPQPFSDSEDRAVSFGIQGIPLDQGNELAYFGLVGTNSVDDIELISFFQPEREKFLEYDLVQMIHTLSNPEPTVVGIMSSLPIMGDMQTRIQGGMLIPWAIARQLKTNFSLVNLPQNIDTLPKSINVMMVVHPRAMSERAIYELEQFLFRGGRAILFLDPKSESDLSGGPEDVSTSASGLDPLFKKWGIEIPEGKFVGDRSMALRVNAGSVARPVPAKYLAWLGVSPDYMKQDDPVTSQLPKLHMASAGFIKHNHNSSLSLVPLITSSRNSSPVSVDFLRGSKPDIPGLLEKFRPDNNTYVIAARLTGEVTTAFPDEAPPRTIEKTDQEQATDPDLPRLIKSSGPVNVIVVTDSDILEDRFWIQKQQFFGREIEQQIAGNANFVINALGNLAGSDALLKLRSRGISQRPFIRVRDIQQSAEKRLRETERTLQDKLKETQTKVAKLQGIPSRKDSVTDEIKIQFNLTDKKRREIGSLRKEMLSIRKHLRTVQRKLREDIENLETWLQFVNIGLVPIIVSAIAILLGLVRIARRRRYYLGTRERMAT